MSRYTMELRELIQSKVDPFDTCTYDLFTPVGMTESVMKSQLQAKITDHYYFREIGHETVGRFKMALKTKMNEIMPYYNQLYASEAIKFDPLVNYNLTVTTTGTSSNKETSTGHAKEDGSGTNGRTDTTDGTDTTHSVVVGDADGTSKLTDVLHGTDITGGTDVSTGTDVTHSTDITHEEDAGTSGGTDSNKSKNLISDTPMGRVTLADTEYVSGMTDDSSDTTTTGTSGLTKDGTNTKDGTDTTGGSHTTTGTDTKDTTDTTTGTSSEDTTTTSDGTDVVHNAVVGTGTDSKTNTTDTTGGVNNDGTEGGTRSEIGNIGTLSFANQIRDLRLIFINIDMQIINELNVLFMGVY